MSVPPALKPVLFEDAKRQLEAADPAAFTPPLQLTASIPLLGDLTRLPLGGGLSLRGEAARAIRAMALRDEISICNPDLVQARLFWKHTTEDEVRLDEVEHASPHLGLASVQFSTPITA